jgi:hypothetical protein
MVDLLRITLLFCSIAGEVLGTLPYDILSDNSHGCECYVTGGSSSAFFTYHRFFDFRDLHDPDGLYDRDPANVTNEQDQGEEISQRGFLNSTEFSKDWRISHWGKDPGSEQPVKFRYSPQNVYIRR